MIIDWPSDLVPQRVSVIPVGSLSVTEGLFTGTQQGVAWKADHWRWSLQWDNLEDAFADRLMALCSFSRRGPNPIRWTCPVYAGPYGTVPNIANVLLSSDFTVTVQAPDMFSFDAGTRLQIDDGYYLVGHVEDVIEVSGQWQQELHVIPRVRTPHAFGAAVVTANPSALVIPADNQQSGYGLNADHFRTKTIELIEYRGP